MALDSYEIKFFAHCQEGTSDKVWGFVEFKNAPEPTEHQKRLRGFYPAWNPPEPGSMYNFWARRGKKFSFKRHYGSSGRYDLERLASKKLNPSDPKKLPYKQISIKDIETILPGFAEEFENQLLLAKFSNAVKSDDTDNNSFI